MAIEGVEQPACIQIDETLRLRRYDGVADFAFTWYQDPELVYLVDGVKKPYSREKLYDMYTYLDAHGELYFIEVKTEAGFVPIGDVTFSKTDLPIVVGEPAYRGQGVGKKVILALMDRGRALGFVKLGVREIYDFNAASIRCFTSCGFKPVEQTDRGWRYEAELEGQRMAWVFMDLEMKPVDRQYRHQWDICRQEVIEFGAVKLGADLREIDSFRRLVKPVYGDIPPRYAKLTGITNDMVADAPGFEAALTDFAAWCGDAETVYAWSGSDLDQLRGEVRMKALDFPLEDLAAKWADFQKIFTRAVGLKRELSLEQAVNIADISFEGHQHDALWDARNTAELYRIYRDETRFNAVIGPLRAAVNPQKQTSFTLADALGDALRDLNLPEE